MLVLDLAGGGARHHALCRVRHFHRVTPYGPLANLAAMPVVSGES